ncbi:MAG: ribose-5-phosphate isomerase A [Candidatus Binatia bacterium]|nr:MAG: ribose-5-phosphate isomerase A [Candidatus Binatia bacterium]
MSPGGALAQALDLVRDGMTLGLGTGRAASAFVRALGERIREGLRVRGIATSESTARLAVEVGIPLVDLADAETIDLTVDGADEVDPKLDLIKGYGGALLREKVVASASRRVVILVGPEKLVSVLGERGKLPVEVVPFALPYCRRRFAQMGYACEPRLEAGDLFRTDNGNCILDCSVGPLPEPGRVDAEFRAVPGVVATGLFVGLADLVIVGEGDAFEVRRRENP